MKRLIPLLYCQWFCTLCMPLAGMAQSLDDLGPSLRRSPSPEQPSAEDAVPAQPRTVRSVCPAVGRTRELNKGLSRQEQIEQAMKQAESLTGEGKFADAISVYSQVITAEPAFAPPYFERAKCFVELKEYDLALSFIPVRLGLRTDRSGVFRRGAVGARQIVYAVAEL